MSRNLFQFGKNKMHRAVLMSQGTVIWKIYTIKISLLLIGLRNIRRFVLPPPILFLNSNLCG